MCDKLFALLFGIALSHRDRRQQFAKRKKGATIDLFTRPDTQVGRKNFRIVVRGIFDFEYDLEPKRLVFSVTIDDVARSRRAGVSQERNKREEGARVLLLPVGHLRSESL